MLSSMMYQWGENKSLLETIVPQLDKYLKFMAFPGVILYQIVILSPWIDLNFRHLSSKLWHYMYGVW